MRPLLALLEPGFSPARLMRRSGAIVGGHPAQDAVLEPVAVALEADHLGVVDKPVPLCQPQLRRIEHSIH